MVCIAAPIRDDSGEVVAAVGIAGPLMRLSKKSIAAFIPHVIATADLVSVRLGYRGRAAGEPQGRPRVKLVSFADLLEAGRAVPVR